MRSSFDAVAPAIDRCFGAGTARAHGERCERTRRDTWICVLASEHTTRWCEVEGTTAHELSLEDDERIPAAPELARAARAGNARILSWRPGRRAVARLDAADGARVVKCFRRGRANAAARRHDAAARTASHGGFRVPHLLAVDVSSECVSLEWLDARGLDVLGERPRMHEVGQRLAAMQRGPVPPASGEHRRSDELALLARRAAAWREHVGPLPHGWDDAFERLHELVADAPLVFAHGDLHDGQLLVTGSDIALIDFDMAAAAEGALDVGNLGAHIYLTELKRAERGRADAAHAALLAGYRAGGGAIDPRALAFFESATALRLALVYGLRPRWSSLPAPLVSLARHFAEVARA